MQLSLPLERSNRVAAIDRRLRAVHRLPNDILYPDPISQLVLAVLGSRTRDDASMAAFLRLAEAFAGWAAVAEASPAGLLPYLTSVTFAGAKAAQLPAALRAIRTRRGALDLDFLAGWPVEDARAWLMALPGVGPKVAAAVLNFSRLRRRALVIDTHYVRVARRLGLLPCAVPDARAWRAIERLLPDAWTAADLDAHHLLMKAHGQTRCRDTDPLCPGCVLADLCAARRAAV
jgi:endonuclease-3